MTDGAIQVQQQDKHIAELKKRFEEQVCVRARVRRCKGEEKGGRGGEGGVLVRQP